MIRRCRRGIEDAGSSGSLNDLSFLLIVFFIVIAGFNVNKGFLLNLPEKEKPRVVNSQDLMTCVLLSDGSISVKNEVMDPSALEEKIFAMKQSFPNMTFLLLVSPQCPYQRVIDVIHSVRLCGVENFSFRMETQQ
ncbi:ExbD/TolR family protein [Treponema sp.]|uniref:ExbD/TolR family protein n=1 Tax=Treponema sp. TaxID=166 RepID=UPI00388E6738